MAKTGKISFLLFLGIVALIGGATFMKVMTRHNEKLLRVAENKIEEAARKCYIEEKCTKYPVTLNELIQLSYLEKQVHPISKEFIDESLVINCEGYSCETTLK